LAFGTLALGQGAALGQSHDAHAHMPELGVANLPVVAAMDQPLVEPEVRRSANSVLSTSLRCAYAYRDIGGVRLHLRAYEGGLAPTLRMKPGETLKIRLINDLPPNRDIPPGNPSHPHQFNNTNLHFHGAHGSPSGIADNVMRLMAPGKSYDIEIALPADHTRGTIRITTARRTCRSRAAWLARSSSKATSPMCRKSAGRASVSCCCRRWCSTPST
jgi:FtsP/CotA-like multicopper oxidase with cupredoxin domain